LVVLNLQEFSRQQSEMPSGEGGWEVDAEHTRVAETIEEIWRDLDVLADYARKERWTDITPVLAELCGRMEENTDSIGSCFISYSHQDESFAAKLHDHLRTKGPKTFYAPENTKGGRKTYDQIKQAIASHDKLLHVLSDHSMQSEWVNTELRRAITRERDEKRQILFPIRLVDMATVMEWTAFDADTGKDLAVEVREYHIPDFTDWNNSLAFERSMLRLLVDRFIK